MLAYFRQDVLHFSTLTAVAGTFVGDVTDVFGVDAL
jgi:hypothetical protein